MLQFSHMLPFNDTVANIRINELRKIEEEKLVQNLAPQYGLEYINLHGYTINPEALGMIPEADAKAALVAAFDHTYDTLLVALKKPNDPQTLELLGKIEKQVHKRVRPFMCSQDSLEHAWKRYADIVNTTAKKQGVFDIDPDAIKNFADKIKHREDVAQFFQNIRGINNSRRVTETLELMFAGALALKASDIHVEPEEAVVRLRYRLDGLLYDIFDIDRFIYERLMSRLKLLAGMTLNHRLEAQDGRFTFTVGDKEIEIRASVIPGAAGESIVMRLLDPSVAGFTMDKINLNPILHAVMKRELRKPNGLILTTGPTSSGKTTALYAFLRETHQEGVKIITIENPVEYKIEGIVQTQIGDDYTFGSGLRAILRQDPDVIMVGEIRDHEVAETAIHAAQTGHLVFSTLHTNSAVGAFPRLIDLGIDARILGSAVTVVLGQRLVRKLCQQCKATYQANPEEVAQLREIMLTHPAPTPITDNLTLYKPVGCAACNNTGYKGRLGVFEAILVDPAVEEVVIRDPREHLILKAARPQGIPTMAEDGADKVLAGDTSLEELARMVELPLPGQSALPELSDSTDTIKNPPAPEDDDLFLAHVVR